MKIKIKILSILVALFSIIGISMSYSLYSENSGQLINTFRIIKDTSIVINETFDGVSKKDVFFTVDSDIPVYLRVRLIFNFLDEEGNILPIKPIKDSDYTLSLNENWKKNGDYYYLENTFNTSDTPALINELENLNKEYALSLDILVQTINKLDF